MFNNSSNMEVSISEIRNFKSCPRRWYLKHVLKIEPPQVGTARAFGTIMHAALETLYRTRGDFGLSSIELEKQIQATPQENLTEDDAKMLRALFDEYYKFAVDKGDFILWDIVAVEAFHSVFMPEWNATFKARFDLVVKDRSTGAIYVVDHKTTKQFRDTPLDMDEQVTSYLWLARRVYGNVKGVIFNRIKKIMPVQDIPMLQNGKPSKNISKLTHVSPATYREVLVSQGLENDADYKTVLDKKSEALAHPFFRRDILTRNDNEIATFVKLTREVIEQMRAIKSHPEKIYPSPGLLCSWCDYATLCHMMNEGKDVNEILEAASLMNYKINRTH